MFLEEYNTKSSEVCYQSATANWNYATDINEVNEKTKLDQSFKSATFSKESWKNITSLFPTWRDFKDPVLLRIFEKVTVLGSAALPDDELKEVLF